jgi:hypothetical protein
MNDEPKEEKHPTASTTSQPQEEFIEQKAQPSQDEHEVAQEAPPKDASEG